MPSPYDALVIDPLTITKVAKGLIEARPKVGTRVSPASRWSFFDPQVLSWHFYAKPDRHFYESLFEVRRALETRAAALATQRRTAENIRVMKYWLHQMDLAEGNLEAHGLSGLEIHRAIAESSGNSLLRSVTGIVELTLALALPGAYVFARYDFPGKRLLSSLSVLPFVLFLGISVGMSWRNPHADQVLLPLQGPGGAYNASANYDAARLQIARRSASSASRRRCRWCSCW